MSRNGIGFTGAHRTGKTTVAKLLSAEMGCEFIQTSTSKIFLDNGLSPAESYNIDTRLRIQNIVLLDAVEKWGNAKSSFVTDRTPIDFIAYTLANIKQEEITEFYDLKIQKYINDCISATNLHFSHVFEVMPGIKIVDEPGKASTMSSHIDHIAYLISGIITSNKWTTIMPLVTMTNIDDRVQYCKSFFGGNYYD